MAMLGIGNVKIDFLSQIEYYIPFMPCKKNEKRRWLIFPMDGKLLLATNGKIYLTHAKKLQIFNLGM